MSNLVERTKSHPRSEAENRARKVRALCVYIQKCADQMDCTGAYLIHTFGPNSWGIVSAAAGVTIPSLETKQLVETHFQLVEQREMATTAKVVIQ